MITWQDITADAVREWLTERWRNKEFSGKTHNYYLRDTKAFCTAAVHPKVAQDLPGILTST